MIFGLHIPNVMTICRWNWGHIYALRTAIRLADDVDKEVLKHLLKLDR